MRRSLQRRLEHADRAVLDAEARAGELATEAARLRAALDALPLSVLVCDEHGRCVARNRGASEMAGSRHAAALAGPAVDELLAAARDGQAGTRTLELHGPPSRTLVISATPLERSGRQVGTVAIVDDASERRRLEAVRRDFVANVSHELRTPVGALGVLAETLAEERDPDVVRRLAQRITAEAERVGRLIQDLLDLSRIETEVVDEDTVVALDAVVAAAAERVRPVAERAGVELVTKGPDVPVVVKGSEPDLVSAVANLLDNAVKYSDPGAPVEVEITGGAGWTSVAVRDQGIGIPTKDLERIFERFYRVDQARSRQTGGTGLGLSIVRHVATNHGGDVLVESQEGRGSTFTLRLPEVRK